MKTLTKEIINKYENFQNPNDNELIYLFCIYKICNSISRRLPNTEVITSWCLLKIRSLENTLNARKINFYNYNNEDMIYAYIKEFELINKKVKK